MTGTADVPTEVRRLRHRRRVRLACLTLAAFLIVAAVAVSLVLIHPGSKPDVVCWGDSFTSQGYPAMLAKISHRRAYNGGEGGESSLAIAARQGGNAYTINPTTIPASTEPVTVTFAHRPGWPLLQGAGNEKGMWTGSLATVRGTISLVRSTASIAHHATDYYTFTRSESGSAVTFSTPQAFVSDFAVKHRDDVAVYWIGRNDTEANGAKDVESALTKMLRYSTNSRYVVLSVTNGFGEGRGTQKYATISATNSMLSQKSGNHYLDVRRYLIDRGLADAGVTPTSQDLADIAADTVPSSLRRGKVHLTATAYRLVAEQVAKKLSALGY